MGIKINVMDTFRTVDCSATCSCAITIRWKLYLMSLRCAETNLFNSVTFHVEQCLMASSIVCCATAELALVSVD